MPQPTITIVCFCGADMVGGRMRRRRGRMIMRRGGDREGLYRYGRGETVSGQDGQPM